MTEKPKKLSIIIPVYNEEKYILTVLKKVLNVKFDGFAKEIIVVNDGSTDSTETILADLEEDLSAKHSKMAVTKEIKKKADSDNILFVNKNKNTGKGSAIKVGIQHATGDVIVIQDSDLECNPSEIRKLLEKFKNSDVDAVYGSRFMGEKNRSFNILHFYGNRFLTMVSNLFTTFTISDMETCYKMFRSDIFDSLEIEENGFGFEPEITAKLSNKGYTVKEVPISYEGRSYESGKKIKWWDGLTALWCIVKYNTYRS